MKETGVVKSIDGDYAVVSVKRETACGESCKNCTSKCNKGKNDIIAKNISDAKIGDRVIIEAPTKAVLKSAFMVYILPLIILIFGYLITENILKNEITSIVVGVFLFVLTFIVLHFWDKKNKNNIETTIIGILGEE